MSLIVVGLNHRSVPLDLLEKMSVPADLQKKALHDLSQRTNLTEVALLSTCNRTEVYARSSRFHSAVSDVCDFLAHHSGAAPENFSDHLYTYYDDTAVAHLFSVAAGLDSMIVGESEILGQVKDAARLAEENGHAPKFLAQVFRHAIQAGKRVRSEAKLGRHSESIASAAVAVASEHQAGLAGARVLVVGAGDMSRGILSALPKKGIGSICVVNRSNNRGADLAHEFGCQFEPLANLEERIKHADIVFSTSAAAEILIAREAVENRQSSNKSESLLILDIALPRDVDPGAGKVDNVTLLDIDDLRDFASRSADKRRQQIADVRKIIDAEIETYQSEQLAREMDPVVTSFRQKFERLREEELAKFKAGANANLSAEEAATQATRALMNKLLHEPTSRLKDAAQNQNSTDLAEALTDLFDLEIDNE